MYCAGVDERRRPRLEHAWAELGALRQRADHAVLDHEWEIIEVLSGPVVVQSVEIEEAAELRQLVVAQPAAEFDPKIEAGDALGTAEELVDRHPEHEFVVARQRILRSELVGSADHLHREIGREAARHDAEVERPRFIDAGEVAGARVVKRLDLPSRAMPEREKQSSAQRPCTDIGALR